MLDNTPKALGASVKAKPFLGLRPRWLAQHERIDEILAACGRVNLGHDPIPAEWLQELIGLSAERRLAKPQPPEA